MTNPRVLVCSPFHGSPFAFNGMIYEFCQVAAALSGGSLLAPPACLRVDPYALKGSLALQYLHEFRRLMSKSLDAAGLTKLPSIRPVRIKERFDLMFFACAFPSDLADLRNFLGWQECARRRVAFIMETWSNLLPKQRQYLRCLDDFDHVFVLNASSIKVLQEYTRAPLSFLPLAADCLTAAPSMNPPQRTVDVFSMGRRAPAVHEQLVRALQMSEIFYVYDTTVGGTVMDWAQSRIANAELIKRSRYFIAYDHTVGSAAKNSESGDEVALSMRYFEGAAGGAVMLGSRPRCAEFEKCFDWPDVVIDMPPETPDVLELIRILDKDRDRTLKVRKDNIINCLLRHDWSHRWRKVTQVCDLSPSDALADRTATLSRMADEVNAW